MRLTWSRHQGTLHAVDGDVELLVAPSSEGRSRGWRLFRRPVGSDGPVVSGDRFYRSAALAQDAGERDPRWPAAVADDGPEAA